MSTTTEKLREAAEHFAKYPSCECDPDSGVFNCMGCDIDRMAQYILATVHPDDDEPVTVEKLKAMGGTVVDHNSSWQQGLFEFQNDEHRTKLIVEVAVDDHVTAMIMDRMGCSVYLIDRYQAECGQLRHLLAGLGMGGVE